MFMGCVDYRRITVSATSEEEMPEVAGEAAEPSEVAAYAAEPSEARSFTFNSGYGSGAH